MLRLLANGRDLRAYGNRGQQRSAALALKLAEVQAMTASTGGAPLLLDDVMSELDANRRSTLLAALEEVEQAILTTTDWTTSRRFRAAAQCRVRAGEVFPASEAAQTDGASHGGESPRLNTNEAGLRYCSRMSSRGAGCAPPAHHRAAGADHRLGQVIA